MKLFKSTKEDSKELDKFDTEKGVGNAISNLACDVAAMSWIKGYVCGITLVGGWWILSKLSDVIEDKVGDILVNRFEKEIGEQ